jgi:hypothetical protein
MIKVVYRESSFVLILVVMVTMKAIKFVANTRIWSARVFAPLQLQETNHFTQLVFCIDFCLFVCVNCL